MSYWVHKIKQLIPTNSSITNKDPRSSDMNSHTKQEQLQEQQEQIGVPSHISIPKKNHPHLDEQSFASDAVGSGEVAEAMGAALDEFALAIDDMLREASDEYKEALKNGQRGESAPGHTLTDSDSDSNSWQYESDDNDMDNGDDKIPSNDSIDKVFEAPKHTSCVILEIKQKSSPTQTVLSDKKENTPSPEGSSNEWACPKCTLLNSDVAPICALCRQINPTVVQNATVANVAEAPDRRHHTERQLKGAIVGGGIAGLVAAGPVLAAIAVTGAAAAVTSGKELALECGDVVADVGVRLKRAARKYNL